MGTEVAIAGLIIAASGTVASTIEARKRADIQEEQQKVQSAQQDVEAVAQRRRQLREQRIRTAQIAQQAELQGTAGSAGEAGAMGALATNVMANIGMGEGRAQTARALGDLSQQVVSSQLRGQLYQQGAQIGSAMFQAGQKDFQKLFD